MKNDFSNISEQIMETLQESAAMLGKTLIDPIQDDTVLLDSGLDSLGFAIVIASLQEKLGYDPFVLSEAAYYPRTYSDLVKFYFDNRPSK